MCLSWEETYQPYFALKPYTYKYCSHFRNLYIQLKAQKIWILQLEVVYRFSSIVQWPLFWHLGFQEIIFPLHDARMGNLYQI